MNLSSSRVIQSSLPKTQKSNKRLKYKNDESEEIEVRKSGGNLKRTSEDNLDNVVKQSKKKTKRKIDSRMAISFLENDTGGEVDEGTSSLSRSSSVSSLPVETNENGVKGNLKMPKSVEEAMICPGPYAKVPMEILAGAAAKIPYLDKHS